MHPQQILIIGGGEIGQAIAKLLNVSSSAVTTWDINPEKSTSTSPLPELVSATDCIFYCAPAASLRETLTQIARYLRPNCTIAILAKGLEPASGKTTDHVAAETLPTNQPTVILGGPMLAEELECGTVVVAATTSRDGFASLSNVLSTAHIRLVQSTDIRGVAVMGVLKNIYTLLLGMESELTKSNNVRGVLITESLQEMLPLCVRLGGRGETVFTLAGIGDFIATASSTQSANFKSGRSFVLNQTSPPGSEGATSLPLLCAILGEELRAFPYLKKIARIVLDGESAEHVLIASEVTS